MSDKKKLMKLAFTTEHGDVNGTVRCFDNPQSLMEWSSNEILKVAGSLGCVGELADAARSGGVTLGGERLGEFCGSTEGRLRAVAEVLAEAAIMFYKTDQKR